MFRVLFLTIITMLHFASIAQANWTKWPGVSPFPRFDEANLSMVKTLDLHVYNQAKYQPCPTKYCFRMHVIVNGHSFGVIPTTPGKSQQSDGWGNKTPEFKLASIAKGFGYQGYRVHDEEYVSFKRQDPLPYFMVFLNNGKNTGEGIHGSYDVSGAPGSHGCLRVHIENARVINLIVRAIMDNNAVYNKEMKKRNKKFKPISLVSNIRLSVEDTESLD